MEVEVVVRDSDVCPYSRDPVLKKFVNKCRVCSFDDLLCPPECYMNWTKCPHITKKWRKIR